MFVPQRPYLPDGTLREALAYPHAVSELESPAVVEAVVRAGLGRYADRLDVRDRWAAILSPGEQQRLHFARVMIYRPDWVFLDESTSALDETSEHDLYCAVHDFCLATTIVSIGHRSSLRVMHEVEWSIQGTQPTETPAGLSKAPVIGADGATAPGHLETLRLA